MAMVSRRSNNSNNNQWRLRAFRTAIALLTLFILVRLFMLQVVQQGNYSALAAVQHNISSVLTPERGRILVQDQAKNAGREYYPVAINKKVENLVVSPKDISEEEAVARELSQIAKLDVNELRDLFSQKNKEDL